MFLYIPIILVVLANCVLLFTLKKSKKFQQNMEIDQKQKKKFDSVTVTVFVVSTIFVCVLLPNAVFRLGVEAKLFRFSRIPFEILYHLSGPILYLNNSVNFYIYCLTGRRFRNEFLRLFRLK